MRKRRKYHVQLWEPGHEEAQFPELEQGRLKLGVKTSHHLKPPKSMHGFWDAGFNQSQVLNQP